MTLSNESIARYRNDRDGLDKQELYYAIDKLCDSHEYLRERVKTARDEAIKECENKCREIKNDSRIDWKGADAIDACIQALQSLLSPPSEVVEVPTENEVKEMEDFYFGNGDVFTSKTAEKILKHYKLLRSQPEVKPYQFKVGDEVEIIEGTGSYINPKISPLKAKVTEVVGTGDYSVAIRYYYNGAEGYVCPDHLRLVKPVEIIVIWLSQWLKKQGSSK